MCGYNVGCVAGFLLVFGCSQVCCVATEHLSGSRQIVRPPPPSLPGMDPRARSGDEPVQGGVCVHLSKGSWRGRTRRSLRLHAPLGQFSRWREGHQFKQVLPLRSCGALNVRGRGHKCACRAGARPFLVQWCLHGGRLHQESGRLHEMAP